MTISQLFFKIYPTTHKIAALEKIMRTTFKTLNLALMLSFIISQASASPAPIRKAPNFSLPDLITAQQTTLNDQQSKVIYLDFWASWCGPCRKSFPALNNLYQEFKDQGLIILGINLDEDIAEAKRFAERHPVKFKLLYDKKGLTPRIYEISAMPSAFIIDRQGNIRETHNGFSQKDISAIRKSIINLLHEDQQPL